MPSYFRDQVTIHYEERGSGFPLLLIAPGGMRSAMDVWANVPIDPWGTFDGFRLIAMDQRNAGSSTGPLEDDDPWGAYAADQLGLLDHLGIDRFLVMGCCIGGSYVLKLAEQAPSRVVAAVLEQPIGVHEGNRGLFEEMGRLWADQLLAARPELQRAEVEKFLAAMWGRDFVVSVPVEVISGCPVPLLVLPGTDDYHPTETGREIAALAPQAALLEPWKGSPELVAEASARAQQFLLEHVAS